VELNERLLAWYRPRRRRYPWRGSRPDPYRVLVSEVMLQQTQASRVAVAFGPFVERYPDIAALAAAPRGDVLRAWGGLGYNRRAALLSLAARRIVADFGGVIPKDAASLASLPGLGAYTSAAIASIAFEAALPAIDTNVARVVARVRLGSDPRASGAGDVRRAAERWIDRPRPGDWNQALMDLGREICRPTPRCDRCPIAAGCRSRRAAAVGSPRRTPSRGGAGGRAESFEGSDRQARGAVVRALREREGSLSIAAIAAATTTQPPRIASVIPGLVADGVVSAGPRALAGDARGRVRLPET
jgi:A/G-specific adenine glycosylase